MTTGEDKGSDSRRRNHREVAGAKAHNFPSDSGGDEQTNTTARTSTATASRSQASVSTSSDRELLSRPPQIAISTARSFATPPNRYLPGEIRHDLFPIAISIMRSVATLMLKIVMPTRSWFMSSSCSRYHHYRCRDFRPTRRETHTEKE
ncbi:hypothetical protein TIFTF001_005282 [Ficus carica]|uniref:Uncharacterized protein n=1 Tax=Ficus carica TaxID=3494 RepID=A0AA87ZXS5_FICCA|nr:hypothetical protein TIFTF001_005282 [Ficus carica]